MSVSSRPLWSVACIVHLSLHKDWSLGQKTLALNYLLLAVIYASRESKQKTNSKIGTLPLTFTWYYSTTCTLIDYLYSNIHKTKAWWATDMMHIALWGMLNDISLKWEGVTSSRRDSVPVIHLVDNIVWWLICSTWWSDSIALSSDSE